MHIFLKEVERPSKQNPNEMELVVYYWADGFINYATTTRGYNLQELYGLLIPHALETVPIPDDIAPTALIAPQPIPRGTYPKYFDYTQYDGEDLVSPQLG